MNETVCRLCRKSCFEIRGYLHRVNPKGVDGIWECRPSCNANLSADEALLAAIEGPFGESMLPNDGEGKG